MKKTVQFLLVAIMCIASLTINASEIYLVGSANGWYEPSEGNSEYYADWTLPETYEGSNIYQRVFELSAGEQYFRFYKALTGWDGGDSYGVIVEDSPVSIVLASGVYYSGSMVQGKGSWFLPDWNGGALKMTVNFNDNSVTFEVFTGFVIDGITYEQTSASEVMITEVYPVYNVELNIPSSVTFEGVNYSVTSLSQSAIKNCDALVSVTIPSSLNFSTSYFDSCQNLEAINIEEGHPNFSSIDGVVFSVDETVLLYCPKGKMGNYVIPDGVITIGAKTELPEILGGGYMYGVPFDGCAKLTSITFPGSVNDMAESSSEYRSCSNLAAFYVSDYNTTYASINGVLTTKDKTKLLYYPAGKEGDYEIPETITVIEHMAFGCAKFSTITISENVASIGSYAFCDCPNLSTVNFNAKNCYVDGSYGTGLPYVYVGCGMTNLNIGESVESLNSYIFSGNGYFP